jgi:hypothetical protein
MPRLRLDVPWRVRLLRQVGLARRAHAEARRLRAAGHPDAVLLADLLRRAVRWRLSRDELHWVNRIEAERRRLATSTDVVHRGDDAPLTVAEVSRASQSWRGGRFLYGLVRAFRPSRGVELGTCVGMSAAYQAAALAADGDGRLVSLEGYPELAAVAERSGAGSACATSTSSSAASGRRSSPSWRPRRSTTRTSTATTTKIPRWPTWRPCSGTAPGAAWSSSTTSTGRPGCAAPGSA